MSEEVDLEKQDGDTGNGKSRFSAQELSTSRIDGGTIKVNTPTIEDGSKLNNMLPIYTLEGYKYSTFNEFSRESSRVRIADVLSNGDLIERLNIPCRDLSESDCAKISDSIDLPRDNSIRLVLLDLDCDLESYTRLIGVLNASLHVGSAFWLACERWNRPMHRKNDGDMKINFRPLEPTCCVVGPYVAKVTERPDPDMAPINVVLLVSHCDWTQECRDRYIWLKKDVLPIILESEESEKWEKPIILEAEESEKAKKYEKVYAPKERIDMYSALLCKEIQEDYLKEIVEKPFKNLFPLMEFQILSMRAATRHNRTEYLVGGSSELEEGLLRNDQGLLETKMTPREVLLPESRQIFRRRIEDFVDSYDQFVRYVTSSSACEGLNDNHMRKLTNDFNHVLEEARRLDLEIRDFIQLNVSNASLEESKKSIKQAGKQNELADAQFEEFKRAKIVTVLAFIFIPLNMATSIFGMNLQELNNSGKGVGVFFAVAITLTLITFACWALELQRMRFINWKKKAIEERNKVYPFYAHGIIYHRVHHTDYTKKALTGVFVPDLKGRIQLLYWAVCCGEAYWLWSTGAIIPVLTADLCGNFKHREVLRRTDSAVKFIHNRLETRVKNSMRFTISQRLGMRNLVSFQRQP